MVAEISANIRQILENIAARAARAGRDASEIKLLAVTKKVDDNRILEALAAGITILGENYVQEALRKQALLEKWEKPVEWHMIGHLQTRKAALAVRFFDMIHSLDRMELAVELNKRAQATGRTIKVLIEVNSGGEATKSGVSPEQAPDLAKSAASLKNLSLQGLMTIPPPFDEPERARPYFARLRELKEEIAALRIPGVQMKELSMGMTADYLIAIDEGATIVRIGRGIFGERK